MGMRECSKNTKIENVLRKHSTAQHNRRPKAVIHSILPHWFSVVKPCMTRRRERKRGRERKQGAKPKQETQPSPSARAPRPFRSRSILLYKESCPLSTSLHYACLLYRCLLLLRGWGTAGGGETHEDLEVVVNHPLQASQGSNHHDSDGKPVP